MNATERYRKTKRGVLTNIFSHQKARKPVYYKLRELHSRFLNNKKFDRLFKEWIKSEYDKQFKPTIDRINYKIPYTLKNIHCLSWSDNRYKQRMELKAIRARVVYMIKGDSAINIFPSQRSAIRISGLNQSGISMCLNGKRKTCGGYKWSYENPKLINLQK